MTNVTIEAGTLTASLADRVVSGLLLPFGEVGRTNLGKFSVAAGVFTIPTDAAVVSLNDGHEHSTPLGHGLTMTATAAGIVASFTVGNTTEGDAYLAEVEAGTKTSLSAEVADVVIRAGQAISGRLYAAAACVKGAFPSATLLATDAGDIPADAVPTIGDALQSALDALPAETPIDDPTKVALQNALDVISVTITEGNQPITEQETIVPEILTAAATAPAGGLAARRTTNPVKAEGAKSLFASLTEAYQSENRGRLLAALDQIIQADADPAQAKQWLGEIYQSKTYVRRYAGLIAHGELTGMHGVGWRFTEGSTPTVGDYAGFPAQPTSTVTTTTAVTVDAARIAGAAAVDRAFQDFKVDGFWQGFYREVTNDYERKIDAKVLTLLTTAGNFTAVNSSLAATPTGIARAAALIVDGAMGVINAERGLPTFAIVGSALYRDLLLTRADDLLAFLNASLNLSEGSMAGFQIVPSANAAYTGKVLVGCKDAATLYELPGSPIRVDTVNVSTGGIETGVFGYWAGLGNDAKGISLVTPVA
ncbi:MAG: hypothetical protein ACOH2F_03570 [Cellulomonas sp.]